MADFIIRRTEIFVTNSRGSAKETFTAITKAKARNLLTEEEFKLLNDKLASYFRLMFGYIKSIGSSNDDSTYDSYDSYDFFDY